ncbi:M15 family metallopeptidase [Clostridium sp. CS001]|uniref:M15 family metallopeptidase n=1 Tax=Clostridium sp. CS001 TaxID=2880648 RepID=UPI001CF311CF|nr:M15 family metallopeptidase [Clostridium sp. CS001]MCB2289001.1 M15 family metallopeptidase [Clostridium sp. CS001]
MRKRFILILFISLLLLTQKTQMTLAVNAPLNNEDNNIYNVTMKQDLLCLLIAYPEFITNIEQDNGYVYLVMKSGKKLKYDDKTKKNAQEKLANPDLQDTLEQFYPLSEVKNIMEENFDPGRSRCYGLLSEVYGTSKQTIESNLKKVNVGYGNYQFNNNNNAARSLANVMKELIPLSQRNPNVRKCLLPCSGTFNYRVISGTSRLSPHAFGIAIDLASDKRDYWKWASKDEGGKRLASYPNELVEVFEKNGFVWGGKWSHFDILHFEYRPEFILKARYFKTNVDSKKYWYESLPLDEVTIKNAVEKIETLIKQ